MNFDQYDVKLINMINETTNKGQNILISPLNISLALSMLLLGSNGNTQSEIQQATGFLKDKLRPKLEKLNKVLNSNLGGLLIRLHNSLYPSKTFQTVENYKNFIEPISFLQIKSIDYNKLVSKTQMNDSCIDENVKNIIAEMISETASVMNSCIQIKCEFSKNFESQNSDDFTFHCLDLESKKSTVKMMRQHNNFWHKYVEKKAGGFQCLKIPFKGESCSMLIILPTAKYGISDVIKLLDVQTVKELINPDEFVLEEVDVIIPKFKISCEIRLKEFLRTLQIKDAFDKKRANLMGIATGLDHQGGVFHVDEVSHKVVIETCEKASDCNAEIAENMNTKYSYEPINFHVDHPFMFMIICKNNVLCMGKVDSL